MANRAAGAEAAAAREPDNAGEGGEQQERRQDAERADLLITLTAHRIKRVVTPGRERTWGGGRRAGASTGCQTSWGRRAALFSQTCEDMTGSIIFSALFSAALFSQTPSCPRSPPRSAPCRSDALPGPETGVFGI